MMLKMILMMMMILIYDRDDYEYNPDHKLNIIKVNKTYRIF